MADLRGARASIREAWRDFRWLEYRPFGWMMLAELLFLFLAANLGQPWGMAGAGWVLRSLGEPGLHYPASFLVLTPAYARLETLVVALAGSFLIPLSLARIQAPMLGAPPTGPDTARRARRAYVVALAGYLLYVAVLLGFQLLLEAGPGRLVQSGVGGFKGELLAWLVEALVAFAVGVLFLYVPIRAVEDHGNRFGHALGGGLLEGFRSFGPTLLILLVFTWPTLLILAVLQIHPAFLVTRFRPELAAVLLAVASLLNSFVTYFVYSAAARLHWIQQEGGS